MCLCLDALSSFFSAAVIVCVADFALSVGISMYALKFTLLRLFLSPGKCLLFDSLSNDFEVFHMNPVLIPFRD